MFTFRVGATFNCQLGILLVLGIFACLRTTEGAFKPNIVVAKDGSGDFKTVQAAVNAIPLGGSAKNRRLIYIKAGNYYETVVVQPHQTYITIVGDPGKTRIYGNRTSGQLDENGDPYRTSGSGVFIALADDFTAINIIFQNTHPRPPPNTYNEQAVALRVAGNRSVIYNCRILSYQDTLYAHRGIQYYKNCYIFGSIDFIFGYAKAYFEGCTLELSSLGFGGFTAQHRRFLNEDNGFVFNGGRITGYGQGWLGRAWGKYAFVIFANMQMDNVVTPSGWNDFGIRSRRYTSFGAEYNNRGVGSNLEGRVSWQRVLTSREVKRYITPSWIGLSSWLSPLPSPLPTGGRKPSLPSYSEGCTKSIYVGKSKQKWCYRCCKSRHKNEIGNCYRYCLSN